MFAFGIKLYDLGWIIDDDKEVFAVECHTGCIVVDFG